MFSDLGGDFSATVSGASTRSGDHAAVEGDSMVQRDGQSRGWTPSFTRDFTAPFCSRWARLLKRFSGQPDVHGIEVGCFEGRSSLWFLQNVLDHETSRLTCIDP